MIPRPKSLSVIEQSYLVRLAFPSFDVRVHAKQLRCVGVYQPMPRSKEYLVQTTYDGRTPPVVQVLEPALGGSPDDLCVTHRYPDGTLCLYFPVFREWGKHMSLVDTTILWTSEWLGNYEFWQATGSWRGGGIHLPASSRTANVLA